MVAVMSQTVFEDKCKLTCPKTFVDNLDEELPSLLTSLNNLESNHFSNVVKFLFGPDSVLNHISNSELENQILKPALLSLNNIFSEKLSKSLDILECNEDSDEEIYFTLSELLQVCLEILGAYNDLLVHLLNSSLLESRNVESLIQTLPHVLLEAFNYCHGSENSFGCYFAMSTDLLTAFFRRSYEVTTLFYKILDERVHFDCSTENDVTLLVTALETLCSLGEIVVSLDVKSLVDQWKAICKMMTKYSSNIKDRLNISKPLKFLILNLTKTISCICDKQEENEQNRTRNLKLGSFILKIIVKLCELYCGYLDTSVTDLLDLLLLLNRCSRLSRKSYNDELERFIVIGAGPLLSYLIQDRQFLEAFKEYCENYEEKTIEEVIGLFYTNLRVLKLLINCNNSEVKEYCLKIPLVQSVIKLFSKSCKQLDLTTNLEGVDTYTSLISVSVAYASSSFTCENFVCLEKFLLVQLFKSDIEVGLLCSDILTLFCRLTDEEVCLKITGYLFQALSLPDSQISRPQVVLVRITAARLYHLLSKSGKETIESFFPIGTHAWRHIRVQSADKLVPATQCFEVTNISPSEFMKKVECLHTVCSSGSNSTLIKEMTINTVKKLLIGLKMCAKRSEVQADWWFSLVYLLMKCVVFLSPKLDTFCFDEILNLFLDFAFLGEEPIFYYLSGALASIINDGTFSLNPSCYLEKSANIFQLCFVCKNIAIKQIAVEKFLSIKNLNNAQMGFDQESQDYITRYSKNVSLTETENTLYSFEINFKHKCHTWNYDKGDSPPNKKFKQDKDLTKTSDAIIKLKGCVENVLLYAKNHPLSLEEKQIVHSAICNLETL